MKAIAYVVALLVTLGSAYFTFEQKRKFEDLQATRIATIDQNKQVSANADEKEQLLKDEKKLLAESENKRELLEQSIAALKSNASILERDVAELDSTLATQADEFAELDKTLKEVNAILADLGGDVSLDNLADKIQSIEDDKVEKQAKLEELETLIAAANKALTSNRSEEDRLVSRMSARASRIARNSMSAAVTAVNQEWGFLVIGAGSNSGFTPQTSLIVQRSGKAIGRVRPSAIEPSQTIAEIDYDSLAPGVLIQPGDRVILKKPASN